MWITSLHGPGPGRKGGRGSRGVIDGQHSNHRLSFVHTPRLPGGKDGACKNGVAKKNVVTALICTQSIEYVESIQIIESQLHYIVV